jgi:hypothetical protein
MKDWMAVLLGFFLLIFVVCLVSWIVVATTPSEEKLNTTCGSDEYISYIYNGKKYYAYCRQVETNHLILKEIK